jgi:hypothetical protein
MNLAQALTLVTAIVLIGFNTLFPPFTAHYENAAAQEHRTVDLGRRWMKTEFTPEYLESVFTGGNWQMAERARVFAEPIRSRVVWMDCAWGLVAAFTWWAFREPERWGQETNTGFRRRVSYRWLAGFGFAALVLGIVQIVVFLFFRSSNLPLLSFLT